MLKAVISGDGELPLLCDNKKVVATDGLEQWQQEQLINSAVGNSKSPANHCLQSVDKIVDDWIEKLTKDQWHKIKRQRSLFGIPIPEKWVVLWRTILKEEQLRDPKRATRGGKAIGSYAHLWNLWSVECINKYLNEMEKHLLWLVDQGYLYSEVGEIMCKRYGDSFWKPRKANTSTTPAQVVNNYLYAKMPRKIARGELTDLVLQTIEQRNKAGKRGRR